MARKLDKIIIIDIEATCWAGKIPPEGQINEIIEIGICVVDVKTKERVEKESILIKPVASNISAFCTELTSITPEMVEKDGVTFIEACEVLRTKYKSRDRVWASWGDYDRKMFAQQCERMQIPHPFDFSHLNAKTLFSLQNGLSKEVGLANGLRIAGKDFEGTHHRGGDDAWNIGGLLVDFWESRLA